MKTPFAAFGWDSMSRRLPTRLVLWSLVVGALFGIFGIGEPLDNLMRVARNLSRSHPASGRIVFVGIDDATLARFSSWPLPRDIDAKIIDNLFSAGARRVFVDFEFNLPSKPDADQALENTLARYGKRVILPVAYYHDPVTGRRTDSLPLARFARHADVASIVTHYDATGAIWQLPYATRIGGSEIPSFAAKIAGVHDSADRSLPLDLSISPKSIPAISASNAFDGRGLGSLSGKDVVLGVHTNQVADFYFAPGYGRIAGANFQIIGAETLMEGRPIDAGWLAPFLLAATALITSFFARKTTGTIGIQAAAGLLLIATPLVCERYLIFFEYMPAITLLMIPLISLTWRDIRARFRARATTNAISGLLNLNALRLETVEAEHQLIVARVHNYAAVTAMLPSEVEEKALITQIASRLTLGTPRLQLYQGDDGVFAWFTGEEGATLEGHLDALYALFRSPATVAGASVDLVVTFGIDSGRDRSIANRFGSALVAATEAVADGTKWKEFDAAKLKDAAWKLSLLGQLDAAIDGGDLWVAYQPKLDLKTNTITGAEALVRWTHREKGDISPMEFIVAAEQNNRIEKLTMHVLERAITAAAAINAHGIPFNIAVNLSVRLLEDAGLPTTILALLSEHGLSPTALTLEITETAAMTAHYGLDVLTELRDHGIKISIDDYGTGMSTLEYLKKIPASEIKIDKSFIQAMTDNASDLVLVNSTIQLAHSLGHLVVAEGVEQAATLTRLTEMGCDTAQGYFIGRPMTFQALSRRLMSERRHAA